MDWNLVIMVAGIASAVVCALDDDAKLHRISSNIRATAEEEVESTQVDFNELRELRKERDASKSLFEDLKKAEEKEINLRIKTDEAAREASSRLDILNNQYSKAKMAVNNYKPDKVAVSVGSEAFFQGYNGRATESFSYSDEVVVVKNKRKAVNCKLSRCVALVSFSSDDVIPAEVSKFRLSLTGVSSKYDMRNQIGVDAATYSTAMVNMNNWKSSAGLMTNVESFVFLPAVESVVNAKFEFFNSADELVLMRNIENIRMRINSKTSVSGSFFQADGMEASMIVDTDWGEEISINAND